MNFFQSLAKGLARAFTIPKATRVHLDNNPAVQAGIQILTPALASAIGSAITNNVKDPATQQIIADAIGAALTHVLPAQPAAPATTPPGR